MPEGAGIYDPEWEQAVWGEYQQRQAANQAQRSSIPQMNAERAAQIAARQPNMPAGAVASLALMGVDDNQIDEIAKAYAEDQSNDPLWRNMLNTGYSGLKGATRWFLTGVMAPFQEIDRSVRAIAAASDVASADEGGFFVGELLSEIPRQHARLPASTLATSINEAIAGRGAGLGSGLLPGGQVEEVRQRQAESVRFSSTGQPVTMGDMWAGTVLEPGSRAYDFTTATINTAWEFGSDPLIALDKPVRAAIMARRTLGGVSPATAASQEMRLFGLVDGPRRTVLPEVRIDNWLDSDEATKKLQWLTETDDFVAIRNRVLDSEAAYALSDATSLDEVKNVIREFAGKQPWASKARFTNPLGRRIARRVEDTTIGRVFESIGPEDGPSWSRIGKWTPADSINLEDVDQATEQFTRWFQNWKAPKETTARFTKQLAGNVMDGDIDGAWRTFREANDELASDLIARGHDKDVVESLTHIMGGPEFIDGRGIRSYYIDQISGRDALHPAVRFAEDTFDIAGNQVPLPSPHIYAEMMDRGIPLVHNQEIRRATSTLSRLADVPGVADDSFLQRSLKHLVDPTKEGFRGGMWKAHDALWAVQRGLWMPLTLVTRIAWPMRVVGEEQVRMAQMGLDSMFHHPVSYLAWTFGNKGDVDDWVQSSMEFRKAQVQGRPKLYYGDAPSQIQSGYWRPVDMRQASQSKKAAAWKIELGKLLSPDSVVEQKVAHAIRSGDNNLDSVADWFWDSDLKRRMMSASETHREAFRHMDNGPVVNGAERSARAWLNSVADRVRMATGGDDELLDAIADRALDPELSVIDSARLDGLVKGKLDNAPNFLPIPAEMADPSMGSEIKKMWDFTTTNLFYLLGAAPSNKFSRSPAFMQLFWQRMADMAPHMDDATYRETLRRARQANLDASEGNLARQWLNKVSTRDDVVTQLKQNRKLAGDSPRIQSFDEADQLAKTEALQGVHSLLYNLDEKGQTAEAMRLIFPFGAAWQEIGKTWLKALGKNPMLLRKAQIGVEGAREAGFFYADPTSGEEMYAQPGVGLLEDWMLGPGGGEAEGLRAIGASRVEGLNLFAGQVMPGVGPVVQMPVSAILPDKPAFDDLRDIILPFGSTVSEPGDFANPNKLVSGLLPAWMRKAATAIGQEGYDERMWSSHVVDAVRALKATGRYDTSTPEGQKELEDAAVGVAKRTLWARALGQMGLPTGFRVDYQVDAGSADADKVMRKVLGEDAMLGKNDGNFFSTAVLSSFWWKLKEDYDGDSYKATRAFLELFGHNPDDYDLQTWVATLGTGKTRALTKRAKTEQGRAWERQHPELVEELPLVVGYFAPEDVATDALDLSAILGDVESGDRIPLSGGQFIRASHKLMGSAIYRNQSAKVEGRNDEQSRAWKANWRSWLDENFPYWRFDDPTLPSGAQFEERLSQLERAVQFEAVQETDAGRALTEYLAKRESALTQLQGMEGITTREQAQTALRTRKSTAYLRSWLRQWGNSLRSQNGGFAPVWEEVLSHEVEGTEEEQ